MSNIPILIQARQSSSRLPSKVMTNFCGGMKMIEFQYTRLQNAFENVIVATSEDRSDDEMCEYLDKKRIKYYRGDLNNVMGRMLICFERISSSAEQWFVRVGGDDPLVSIEGIRLMCDNIKSKHINNDVAMYYSSYDQGMTYGCAVEIFRVSAFKEVTKFVENMGSDLALKKLYLEHTKPAFQDENILKYMNITSMKAEIPKELQSVGAWLSIDYPEDFLVVSYLINQVVNEKGINYSHEDLLSVIRRANKDLFINKHLHTGFGE